MLLLCIKYELRIFFDDPNFQTVPHIHTKSNREVTNLFYRLLIYLLAVFQQYPYQKNQSNIERNFDMVVRLDNIFEFGFVH